MKKVLLCILLSVAVLISGCQLFASNVTETNASSNAVSVETPNVPDSEIVSIVSQTHSDTESKNKSTDSDSEKKSSDVNSTKKTESKTSSKSVSTVEIKKQNGYTICPVCSLVHLANEDCPMCEGEKNGTPFNPIDYHCPMCGGGYITGDPEHSVFCRYCNKEFKACPDGTPHCKSCGKCGILCHVDETAIIEDCGYCIACATDRGLLSQEEMSACPYCGGALTTAEEVNRGYCTNCMAMRTCYICGTFNSPSGIWERVCGDCDNHCISCGTPQGGREFIDGLCEDCYNTQQNSINVPNPDEPNIWCPSCGYGWFITGVGIDGFTCPSCGYSWK